jgi:hypothetical protein
VDLEKGRLGDKERERISNKGCRMTNDPFFRITSSPNGEINGSRMGAVEVEIQSHSAALILMSSKVGAEAFSASPDDRLGGSDSLI